jgi:hypothetical protein
VADVPVDALFHQVYVDARLLAANVRRLLQREPQVTLGEVLRRYPATRGLAEVLAYLSLAARDARTLVDEDQEETVAILSADGRQRRIRLPRVVFTR